MASIFSLYDRISTVSVEELRNDLLLLPAWRKEKALSFRHFADQVQSVKAYLLLMRMLRQQYGISGKLQFSYGPYGKPFLLDYPDIHFSLSHCRKAVLCVVGDEPVGGDVEEIPEALDQDVLNLCFDENEQSHILLSPKPCVRFAEEWTRKEALLKMVGCGLVDDLPGVMRSSWASHAGIDTFACTEKGYAYSICKTKENLQMSDACSI